MQTRSPVGKNVACSRGCSNDDTRVLEAPPFSAGTDATKAMKGTSSSWHGLQPLWRLMHPSPSLRSTLIALTAMFAWTQAQGAQPALGSFPVSGRHSSTNIHELRWRWKYDQRAYPLGYIPDGALNRALRQIQQSKASSPRPLVGGGSQWVNIGPAPIANGHVTPAAPGSGRAPCLP